VRLKALTPNELSGEQRELYDLINGGPRGPVHVLADGSLQGPFNAMLHHPVVGKPLQQIGAALRYRGVLTPRARELAILTVAAAYRSEFEWHAHAPIAAELGVAPSVLETIRRGEEPRLDDELEEAVLEVTRTMLERRDLDDAAWERVSAVITAPEVVELTTLVGYYATLAVQMQYFRTPLPNGVEPVFSTS
jgi:4-carboxymuconolactone decarboxylase